ncbi:MAG: ABC transporter permease [Bryobacteraceae bacterium]|nr:ABC transporter permease [Bryobacteraceae bacterium]
MVRDFQHAVRWLRQNPLFGISAILILALGIGATTAVFSIVDAVLLRPLPYEAAERLVRVDESASKRPISGVPAADYMRWRDRTDLFEKTVPYLRDTVTLTGSGEPEQVAALRASGALFPLLGVHAHIGRALMESDDEPGSAKVAVISDRLWRKRFQADPGVVGRAVTISDEVFTIAGVMPREFAFPQSNVDVWAPFRVTPTFNMWFQVVARLKPGVTLPQAGSALEVVARQMEQESPKDNEGLRIAVTPWSERADTKYESTIIFVLAAVGLVLLIACADVGSLLLSRAVQRQREIAIRSSLGAGFWRVTRQLLTESFVLVVMGSAAGVAVAYFLLQFLARQLAALPIVLPHLQHVALNARVLLFSAGLCMLLVVLCSLAPVLMAFRTDIQSVLRGVRTGTGPKSSTRLFSFLIASEAAFACLLLVGSGLMVRSLLRLQQEDHGFRADHVLTLRVPVGMRTSLRPPGKYDTRPRQMAYYNEILERVERIPGISAAAVVNNLPLSGVSSTMSTRFPDGKAVLNSTRTVSPQYFAAMGIPVISGRTFTDRDHAEAPGVAIINEYLARQLFPNTNPVGLVLPSTESSAPPVTVVGVVKDTTQVSYDQPVKGEIYRPIRQFIFAAFMSTIVVRTPGDPRSIAVAVQKEVWAVNPDQPVVKVETMEDVVANSIWRPRFSAWIFSALGTLALLLTAAGIYGVVAYTSSLRAHETGIRIALGATPRHIVANTLRTSIVPVGLGLAAGLLGAVFLSRVLESVLYEVQGTDPLTYLGAVVLLLGIGIAASIPPAWRSALANPVKALRAE